ncbi:MAG: chromate transporter [Planctomycetes bacterium]|nr:chromate transporter [Planctomycetota bacterium]
MMKEDISAQADQLFKQGLFHYTQSKTSEGIKIVTDLWQKAIELYRQIGDQIKVKEVESYFNRLSRNILKKASPESFTKRAKEKSKKLFNDWWVFLKIGCFGVGGPMAVLGLLQEELVNRKKVLDNKDFLEGTVLGDIIPGPVTMDLVTYTGFKLRKWTGAILATVVFILPSFFIMLILAKYYDIYNSIPMVNNIFKCLGAAVVAIIISVGINLGKSEIKDYWGTGILLWSFISFVFFRVDMIIVIFLAGLVGILVEFIPPPPALSTVSEGIMGEVKA